MILGYHEIDNGILAINRKLNEGNAFSLENSIDSFEKILNEEFYDVLPLKYTLFQLIPFNFPSMKDRISVKMVSNSLCIDFPDGYHRRYCKAIESFRRYLEDCWEGRVSTVYSGGAPTFVIKLITTHNLEKYEVN